MFNFEKNKPISLLSLKPNIVFYQQPWDLYFNQSPRYCFRKTLSLYIPYSILVVDNPDHYALSFHKFLWKIFLDSKLTLKRFIERSDISDKCIVTGNPKIEANENYIKKSGNLYGPVIFAPHHSFEENSLKLATFIWSGFAFLEFAEKNQDVEFIFKPHPRFKYALEQNMVFSKDRIVNFYERLNILRNVTTCENGNYLEIFDKSRLLITDCGSFLAEYYLLNKPVIHLENTSSVGLTELGKIVTRHYYSARNVAEFVDVMNMAIIKKHDPMFEYRKVDRDIFELNSVKPSVKIIKFLEKQFEGDDE